MSDWWEEPYKGGPMVKVPGFPRPVYPSDAKGKQPSRPGPDIEAYKRTVSRAGRWPWQEFDQAFSNQFSHGASGNVQDTGVAGVQRQMHLDATGWIGEKTFNTLRSIRVPEGGPHAGEMAMDARAADLIAEAWEEFAGVEPPPAPAGSVRSEALKLAVNQMGYTESPPASNSNKYGSWYGMNHVPWCAIFCTWCYLTVNPENQSFIRGSRWAYCPYIVADARANRYGVRTTDDPIPGDLVVYDWSGDTVYDHVGLFEGWTGPGHFTAIEGNTSTSNNSNGGAVMRRARVKRSQGTVFVRVSE